MPSEFALTVRLQVLPSFAISNRSELKAAFASYEIEKLVPFHFVEEFNVIVSVSTAHVADVVMAVNSNMTNLSMSYLRCEAESPVTRLANEVILLIILFVFVC